MEDGIGFSLLELGGQAEFKVQIRIAREQPGGDVPRPAVVEGVSSLSLGAIDLILGVAVVAAAEFHRMFAFSPRQAKYLVVVLSPVPPWVIPRSPGCVERGQSQVGQAVKVIVLRREVRFGAPS